MSAVAEVEVWAEATSKDHPSSANAAGRPSNVGAIFGQSGNPVAGSHI